jgi:hypothetical protein
VYGSAGYVPHHNTLNSAAFNAAVWRLHATIFAPYLDWAEHQRAQPFPGRQQGNWDGLDLQDGSSGLPALLDLCAYFCLWTEAANVKHMPEALWFLFWCAAMRFSCSRIPWATFKHLHQILGVKRSIKYGLLFQEISQPLEYLEAVGYRSVACCAMLTHMGQSQSYLRYFPHKCQVVQ